MKKRGFCGKVWLALLCLGALCLGGCARRAAPQAEAAVLTFPAQAAQEGESFSVSFDLPEGWTPGASRPSSSGTLPRRWNSQPEGGQAPGLF